MSRKRYPEPQKCHVCGWKEARLNNCRICKNPIGVEYEQVNKDNPSQAVETLVPTGGVGYPRGEQQVLLAASALYMVLSEREGPALEGELLRRSATG